MKMYNVDNLINKKWTRATLYGHLFITVTRKFWSPLERHIIFINVLIHLISLFIELWPSVYCDREVMSNCSISYVTLICTVHARVLCACMHAHKTKCKIIPYIQLFISFTCIYRITAIVVIVLFISTDVCCIFAMITVS